MIDTERGSASLYANKFKFDVLELEKHGPLDYIEALELAASASYDVVVIDSFSHAWIDSLEKVDQAIERGGGNNFTAWRKVSPAHSKLVDAILSCPMHVIATMRSKVEYAMQENDKGKKEIKKLGLAPVQRSGVDYEFTIVGDLNLEHQLLISKSRSDAIPPGEVFDRPGEAFAKRLRNWLDDGAIVDHPVPIQAPRTEVVESAKVTTPIVSPTRSIMRVRRVAGRHGCANDLASLGARRHYLGKSGTRGPATTLERSPRTSSSNRIFRLRRPGSRWWRRCRPCPRCRGCSTASRARCY